MSKRPYRIKDMTGQRFGRLTVLFLDQESGKDTKWICECDCGNKRSCSRGNLTQGRTLSCGCYNQERRKEAYTHGKRYTNEYGIWNGIKMRCFNPNRVAYRNYGGRGISMCEEWRNDFAAFLRDMGERPSKGHSVERKDTNGNYEPGNCYWATRDEQARNRRARNQTGQVGVYITKFGVYIARIRVNNNLINLGSYRGLDSAVQARKSAEAKYWGKEA